ncbi:MAG: MBL fold metallo-hydrolase [Acidobacteria bacterium]|nr:MBL fold metallo-hydrolase [Acidobacteriota bacterium]
MLRKGVVLSISILLILCSSLFAALEINTQKVGDNIVVFMVDYKGGSTIAINTDKGIVVVDSNMSYETAGNIRNKIEKMFPGKKIAYLINTHSHFDHNMGNQVYTDVPIIAHENVIEEIVETFKDIDTMKDRLAKSIVRLEEAIKKNEDSPDDIKIYKRMKNEWEQGVKDMNADFKLVYPNLLFNDKIKMDMGNITLELEYYPSAHTNSDIIIYIPQEKALLTGDLFLSYQYAVLVNPQGKSFPVEKWLDMLDDYLNNKEVKYVITSHGSINDIDFLKLRRKYISDIWEDVKKAYSEGAELKAVEESHTVAKKYQYIKETGFADDYLEFVHKGIIDKFWFELERRKTEK